MITAGVDFHQLLSAIREIYKAANTPDTDGTQLEFISETCKDLLISAGHEVPERLETDTFPLFAEDVEDDDEDNAE